MLNSRIIFLKGFCCGGFYLHWLLSPQMLKAMFCSIAFYYWPLNISLNVRCKFMIKVAICDHCSLSQFHRLTDCVKHDVFSKTFPIVKILPVQRKSFVGYNKIPWMLIKLHVKSNTQNTALLSLSLLQRWTLTNRIWFGCRFLSPKRFQKNPRLCFCSSRALSLHLQHCGGLEKRTQAFQSLSVNSYLPVHHLVRYGNNQKNDQNFAEKRWSFQCWSKSQCWNGYPGGGDSGGDCRHFRSS